MPPARAPAKVCWEIWRVRVVVGFIGGLRALGRSIRKRKYGSS
jgi:hypothetical protein